MAQKWGLQLSRNQNIIRFIKQDNIIWVSFNKYKKKQPTQKTSNHNLHPPHIHYL